jgi:DNA-binding protein H-NS
MRKPRVYDAELEALDHKAKALRQRKISQLGELVIACGADVLPVDVLAGALLAAASSAAPEKEAWRKAGAAMFHRKARRSDGGRSVADPSSPSASEGTTESADREPRPE